MEQWEAPYLVSGLFLVACGILSSLALLVYLHWFPLHFSALLFRIRILNVEGVDYWAESQVAWWYGAATILLGVWSVVELLWLSLVEPLLLGIPFLALCSCPALLYLYHTRAHHVAPAKQLILTLYATVACLLTSLFLHLSVFTTLAFSLLRPTYVGLLWALRLSVFSDTQPSWIWLPTLLVPTLVVFCCIISVSALLVMLFYQHPLLVGWNQMTKMQRTGWVIVMLLIVTSMFYFLAVPPNGVCGGFDRFYYIELFSYDLAYLCLAPLLGLFNATMLWLCMVSITPSTRRLHSFLVAVVVFVTCTTVPIFYGSSLSHLFFDGGHRPLSECFARYPGEQESIEPLSLMLTVVASVIMAILFFLFFMFWYLLAWRVFFERTDEYTPILDPATFASMEEKPQLDFSDILSDGAIIKVLKSEIEQLEQIGEGGFGTVYRGVWHRAGNLVPVAIKKQRFREGMDEEAIREFYLEIKFLANLEHPNILGFVGVVARPSEAEIWILTEFLEKGSLRDHWASSLPVFAKIKLLYDVSKAMVFLHANNPPIVHRDLKLENCLVTTDGVCKVSDFGTTTCASYTMTQQLVGTIHILAPEVIKHEKYSELVDVYSFGISATEFLADSSFHQVLRKQVDYDYQILDLIMEGTRPVIPDTTPPALAGLLRECFSAEPERRPPFTEIRSRLLRIHQSLASAAPENI